MGLESYLFNVEFYNSVPEQEIVNLFVKVGMTHLSDRQEKRTAINYGSFYFELRTDKGLTEAHCLLAPSDISLSDFSLRFSVVSPASVVKQTFDILEKVNAIQSIKVYDTEISNHIYRKLRKEGKVDRWLSGLEGTTEEEEIEKMREIPIDIEIFQKNEFEIMKRQIVLSNNKGEIIEGGTPTIEYIDRKGIVDRFIGWVKKEL
jgi:hypothetical protein